MTRRARAARRHLAAATIATTALLGGGDMIDVAEGHHDAYRRISSGQINGNGAFLADFRGTSSDGAYVWFQTSEQLVAADTDAASDVYEHHAGRTTLVSAGAINGNSETPAFFSGASANGTRVFFETNEQLVASDTDSSRDIYQRFNGVTTRISVGKINGNGEIDANFVDATPDGASVFFETDEKLVSGDTDSQRDVYRRAGGKTKLMSVGGNSSASENFNFASSSGGIVVWTSDDSYSANDTDGNDDVFMRQGTTTSRVSIGTQNGNGDFEAEFSGASSDGSKIFFETAEKLLSNDTDDETDVYMRTGGATTRLTLGPTGGNGALFTSFEASSADGSKVFFSTPEKLVASDTDSNTDIYMRQGTTTTLISAGAINGNGAFSVGFLAVSTDGSRVFFQSPEQLVSADTDSSEDIYMRQGSTTTLVSAGEVNGNGAFEPNLRAISADGSVAVFETNEQLVSDDTDPGAGDVYSREDGETFLVSAGNGNAVANYAGLSPNGNAIFFHSLETILINDTDSSVDVYGAYN